MKLRPSLQTAMRLAWITMLIPGFLRVPLPQADFHNIRHHHGVGEVCPHHDHLLRWHPTASQNDDVAIVHWHWILPRTGDPGDSSTGDHDDPAAPPRLLLHAYHLDCLEPDWSGEPVIGPDQRGRLLRENWSHQTSQLLIDVCRLNCGESFHAWAGPCFQSGIPGNPRVGLLGLFQQRNC